MSEPASNVFFRKWVIKRRRRDALLQRISPPQVFVGSFALLVLLGTLGLKLLPGLCTGAELSWLDALFTATSAVCVTGLTVEDTATFFTPAGQAFVLLLIQIGGLGIIAFTSLIIVALGRRLSLRQEALSTGTAEVAPHVSRHSLVRDVVLFTLGIEALGALLLYIVWIPRFGLLGALWPAVFHSVSAFCNAGFSTFSDSLIGFQSSPFVLLVIMGLIVVGGLGFLTLEELYLYRRARNSNQRFRVSLHSRIVLVTTAVLLVGGWVLFCLFEWHFTLAHLPWWTKVLDGLFLSVTPRTAGFNVIDYAQATESTNFLTILLMSIGGAPGSTAGGLKVTTFALIGLLAWSRFRGHEITSIVSRSVPEETIQRAVGLFVVVFGTVTVCIFILTATELRGEERGGLLRHMFEAASAFNTVGLTMGVTHELSPTGKGLIVLLMFLGRVGPLTFAAALAKRQMTRQGKFRYAYEDVVVG